MRSILLLAASLFLFAGCATFKELKPKPELSPLERGYIELTNDDENFKLDGGKQYFIKFPSPSRDNYALVLQISTKNSFHSYLTTAFDDGKEPIVRMIDEAASHDSLSVYALTPGTPVFFWVIDNVKADVELRMHYRFVPRWRYTYETKYTVFKKTLADNLVDRGTYTSSPGSTSIDAVDFDRELSMIAQRKKVLGEMNSELKEVASLFPPDITAGRDTAYINYQTLRSQVEDELKFQEDYTVALRIFQKNKGTAESTGAFVAEAGSLADFLSQGSRFPAPILDKARKAIQSRLMDVVPYYDKQLRAKRDVKPIAFASQLESIEKLYKATGRVVPGDFAALRDFVRRFNTEAEGLKTALERLAELRGLIDKAVTPPLPSLYASAAVSAQDIKSGIPQALAVTNERYRTVDAAALLALELGKAGELADDLQTLFQTGEQIAKDIEAHAWAPAESKTRDLYEGREGKTMASATRYRDKLVNWFETDIFNGVNKATQERVDAFVKLNESTIAGVPGLYADSAFTPVYSIMFSSAGQSDLARKRGQIGDYITRVKNFQFPEAAIRAIYKDFGRDMNAPGVDRARAIVEHGKMYKGNDKELTGIVTECDPMVAKWIVRPKEYRRILALPVTTNRHGINEYVFRVKLQIPSEAQFPVFDINIKLPKELAETAGREQWYDQITINKNPIKNEGRFRITAPTSENNYESQVTPVQMDKEGNNILEVRFKKSSFKVYEISAMAQVPIMKKN